MDMDAYWNPSVSGECQQEIPTLDELFNSQNTEVDFGMEWLSVFVEDCFSSKPNCFLAPLQTSSTTTTTNTNTKPSTQMQRPELQINHSLLQSFAVPGKARSKRKRLSASRTKSTSFWSHHIFSPKFDAVSSDPPLLKQAYWLADSELIKPRKKDEQTKVEKESLNSDTLQPIQQQSLSGRDPSHTSRNLRRAGDWIMNGFAAGEDPNPNPESLGDSEVEVSNNHGQQNPIPRRCSHCLAQRTPQWRAGPLGPKTLCNACGVRYKSGRLLPEYRPAKSPTFVSYLHSNSHKKVLEMRMDLLSSIPTDQ